MKPNVPRDLPPATSKAAGASAQVTRIELSGVIARPKIVGMFLAGVCCNSLAAFKSQIDVLSRSAIASSKPSGEKAMAEESRTLEIEPSSSPVSGSRNWTVLPLAIAKIDLVGEKAKLSPPPRSTREL